MSDELSPEDFRYYSGLMKRYYFTSRQTDDGLIDMFIMGWDGIPLARIKEPVQSGEDAIALARAYIENLETEETEESEEDAG